MDTAKQIINSSRYIKQEVIPGNGYSPYTGYTVFRAYDKEEKKQVVIKSGGFPNTEHRNILSEYEILRRINYLGVIKVLGFGFDKDKSYFIMENHELGGRRSRWRELFKNMSEAEVRQFCMVVITSLDKLREIDMINEDIEMANIVASQVDLPILIDFGRAKYKRYMRMDLLTALHPDNNTRMNAWVRELCGIGGKYEEEGVMHKEAKKIILYLLQEWGN